MKKISKNIKNRGSKLVAMMLITAGCVTLPAALSVAQEPMLSTTPNGASLNFVNADIESVVKAIGHYTGTTFVIDPRVKGQITLVSEVPLNKDQAFKLLTSNLRMQGFAVVTADGFAKVVPEADAKLHGGPTQTLSTKKVKGDQIVTQIYRINYESANNIVTALRPLISPNNVINVNPGNNTIIITDYADNQRRMSEVIALLDVPANPELDVIPIKYSIASDVAAIVLRMTDGNGSTDGSRTIVMADQRTNSVLVKAPTVAKSNLIKSLVAKLDQPTSFPGNVHVVYLKNAEAVKLAQTLRSIVGNEASMGAQNSGQTNSFNSQNTNVGPTQNQAANSAVSSSITNGGTNLSLPISTSSVDQNTGGAAGFIQADSATNTLIITASDTVYRNLRGVIDQLDARRAQVYIESLIVEVNAGKESELGVQWLGATGDKNSEYRVGAATSFNSGSNNLVNLIGSNAAKLGSALPGNGMTIGLFRQIGGQIGLGALAHALSTDGSSNVLSIPNLVTLDNEEARIHVGQNVPFITGQFTSAASGAGTNPFQTIERKDVGIKLVVKPQISEGGTVKLAIAQEVSSVDSTTNAAGIITNNRSISTNVLAEDGQIIALGGLIGDDVNDGVEKVTFLGDLPIIGNLFKYKTQKRKKTNLMVFLRPTIIRNAEDSKSISIDRYDYLRAQYINARDQGSDIPVLQMEKGKLILPTTQKSDGSMPSEINKGQ